MATKTNVTLTDLFRASPAEAGLFALGPLVVALAQLANSYFHDLPLPFALALCAVMVTFSVVVTRHLLAELRLRRLEGDLFAPER